jgi:hypothetical protein
LLHCGPLKFQNFDFNANQYPDPDPAFHSNADPAQASQNNVDLDTHPASAVDETQMLFDIVIDLDLF